MVQKVSRWREQAKFINEKVAEKAGLGPNVKNHSRRNKMIQSLTNNDIPATDIIQLSRHKTLQSVTNYSILFSSKCDKLLYTLKNSK